MHFYEYNEGDDYYETDSFEEIDWAWTPDEDQTALEWRFGTWMYDDLVKQGP